MLTFYSFKCFIGHLLHVVIFAVTGNIKPLLPTELIFYGGNLDNKNRKLYIIHVIICVTLVSPVEENKIEKWNGEWRCVCVKL